MKRETGKDRWKRVPKDYFKKRDRLQRLKLQLSALAFLLALGWWLMGIDWAGGKTTSTDRNGLRANHGELAVVHAAWDNKCDACHQSFVPIDGRPFFSSKSNAEGASSDTLCMNCHAGPTHHASMVPSEVKTCAECHRDHQGRGFSLVKLKDGECTTCHQQIEGHMKAGAKPLSGRILGNASAFGVDSHPQFEPETATVDKSKPAEKGKAPALVDKGKLKFNHALHMMPGLVKDPKDTPYTVDQIPIASERARYQKGGSAKDSVKLECASCHVLDGTEVKAPPNPAASPVSWPTRNSGTYFLPISYEASCRACHVLTFDPKDEKLEAPHGLQPDKVVEFLERTYAARIILEDPSMKKVFVPPATIPGKTKDEVSPKKQLQDSVTTALKFVFTGVGTAGQAGKNTNNCVECHTVQSKDDKPTWVEPTKVPEIWYTRSVFDHSAHKGVSCRSCHSRSFAVEDDHKTPVKDSSKVATDVLVPGLDNCVQCHAPTVKQGGWFASPASSTTGGVAYDCTKCHRYHNGDNRLQGYGAAAEDATQRRNIEEFLMGSGGKPVKPPAEKAAPEKTEKP